MTDQEKQRTGHECQTGGDPATQPHVPGCGTECEPWPTIPPLELEPPTACPPDPDCKCPAPPTETSNCLQKLIDQQTTDVANADKAKQFKADLEALLAKAKLAAQAYNRDKYLELLKDWKEQDEKIAELVRKLVCTVPCWRCIIECYVCPLLNGVHESEELLYRPGTRPATAANLYEQRYWLERDLEAKQRRMERIKTVLAVWETPAVTLKERLDQNRNLCALATTQLGTDPAKVVYGVFLKLLPTHLAIAPPADTWETAIGSEYTRFCCCDEGTPDDCCGPDVGEWSLRQRLIGPQPYLVDPCDYYKIICCLVEQRYRPAKDAVALADAAFQTADGDLKRRKSQMEAWLKTFENDAKNAIPSATECCHGDHRQQIKLPQDQTGRRTAGPK